MNPTIWVLVAVKIFVVFWLIYYIFERRKRKTSQQNLSVREQGMVTTYAGAPVTQIPKDYNEYNQQQLYAASTNAMPPNPQSTAYSNQYPNIMTTKS